MSFRDDQRAIVRAMLDTFGEDVVYRPKAGGEATIKAVWDRQYIAVDQGQAVVDSTEEVIAVHDEDAPAAVTGDVFVIDGVEWKGTSPQRDERGLVIYKRVKV